MAREVKILKMYLILSRDITQNLEYVGNHTKNQYFDLKVYYIGTAKCKLLS